MSEYKDFNVTYTMVDGEVFNCTVCSRTEKGVADLVTDRLEEASFCLGVEKIPVVILVSANVRNVEIVERYIG